MWQEQHGSHGCLCSFCSVLEENEPQTFKGRPIPGGEQRLQWQGQHCCAVLLCGIEQTAVAVNATSSGITQVLLS